MLDNDNQEVDKIMAQITFLAHSIQLKRPFKE